MKLHHLRNATLIIEVGEQFILVDPMLGNVGTLLPFSLFRFKAKRNPLVELPSNSAQLLDKVTVCIVTHLHPDHLDEPAEAFLKSKNIPVFCNKTDEKKLKKRGLNVTNSLEYWTAQPFLNGSIKGIPAVHGYGFIAGPMGKVMGFFIQLPNHPSIYISADTVLTNDVKRVLTELKPDVSVLACGSAQLDFGKPLLMNMNDLLEFIKLAPGKVFANHLEALNHCPTTRTELKNKVSENQLTGKVFIPNDGEFVEFA